MYTLSAEASVKTDEFEEEKKSNFKIKISFE
jgi:hypothetical protein